MGAAAIEGLRFDLLSWTIKSHQDTIAQPTKVFQNIADDKVAGRWLLATPGSNLQLFIGNITQGTAECNIARKWTSPLSLGNGVLF